MYKTEMLIIFKALDLNIIIYDFCLKFVLYNGKNC